MSDNKMNMQIRWSDLDPNFHLRHSVYYDWGAFCRIEFLNNFGLTANVMAELHFGPILFREECIFRKEIRLGDQVSLDVNIIKAKHDYSRWSIQHNIRNGDVLAAVLTVDGAWMNTVERKLASPPPVVKEVFENIPKSDIFEWMD